MTHRRGAYKGRVSPPDVSEFSSLFPQPFKNIGISAINLHTPTVHLPLVFSTFLFCPKSHHGPKTPLITHGVRGQDWRLWSQTVVDDPPFGSAPLAAIIVGLGIGVSIGGAISQAINTFGMVEEVETG